MVGLIRSTYVNFYYTLISTSILTHRFMRYSTAKVCQFSLAISNYVTAGIFIQVTDLKNEYVGF